MYVHIKQSNKTKQVICRKCLVWSILKSIVASICPSFISWIKSHESFCEAAVGSVLRLLSVFERCICLSRNVACKFSLTISSNLLLLNITLNFGNRERQAGPLFGSTEGWERLACLHAQKILHRQIRALRKVVLQKQISSALFLRTF